MIPFSDKELAKHRLGRNESAKSSPGYWDYLRVRGSAKIDVAGQDRLFKPATAEIRDPIAEDGQLNVTWIYLQSAQVGEPLYICCARGEHETQANLVHTSGEKAEPFQTLPQGSAGDE
ncbi:MAG: hypothetical protein P8L85_09955 [Rubripirellula sp.]|nr:hypothetical protein [Rubripirellula sp.]